MGSFKSSFTLCKLPKRYGRARTPTILQMEAMECGAAALGIILAYYQRFVPLAELRQSCGVSRDGSQASHILNAARYYGLTAQGFSVELEGLDNLECPYIVYWNFKHFVVIERVSKKSVAINDPSTGPRTISMDEFSQAFTGVVLAMEPGPDFSPGGEKPSKLQAFQTRLRGAGKALAYSLGAGFLLVIPGLAVPILTQVFVDHLLIAEMQDWLPPLLIGLLITAIFRGAVEQLQLQALRRLQLKLAVLMSSRFLWHLLHLPLNFFTQRNAGDISDRLALNNRIAEVLSGRLTTTLIDVSTMCVYSVVMWQYSVVLTLIGLGCALLNITALKWVARRRVDANMRMMQERGKVSGVTMAALQQIDSLKASALESDFFARWSGYYANEINAYQDLEVTNQALGVLPGLLTALASTCILVIGGLHVIDGVISIGMLVAFQSLMHSFLTPLARLVDFVGTLQELQVILYRLDDVLDNPAIFESPQDVSQIPVTLETFRLQGHVQARGLTFGHSPVSPPVIDNVHLGLSPGKWVAVVGASGSGKSTLAKLICGLYVPWEGELLFDGVPRSQCSRSVLTHSIASVDQDLAFFAATIRDNLTLWDTTVTDHQLVQACQDAMVHDVIVAMPGGYEAMLLEGATNLSGGERQRLEIARALVHDPAILILDEATSALDAEIEYHIIQNLRRRGCACLIVAHRLSTIRACDEIIVLDQGKVAQRGPHDILFCQDGIYRHLLASENGSLATSRVVGAYRHESDNIATRALAI